MTTCRLQSITYCMLGDDVIAGPIQAGSSWSIAYAVIQVPYWGGKKKTLFPPKFSKMLSSNTALRERIWSQWEFLCYSRDYWFHSLRLGLFVVSVLTNYTQGFRTCQLAVKWYLTLEKSLSLHPSLCSPPCHHVTQNHSAFTQRCA